MLLDCGKRCSNLVLAQNLSVHLNMKRSSHEPHAAMSKAQRAMTVKRMFPHCSQSAFTSMVKLAKTTDMSDLPTSRKVYRDLRQQSLKDTPYGSMFLSVPLIAQPPHANTTMLVVNPFALLYTAFQAGGGFYDLIKAKSAEVPSSAQKPWRLCVYSDEVLPGNQLATHHARKVWVIYFSFLELHPHLSNERAWFPLIAEPTVALKHVSAGISQVFAQVVKLFWGTHSTCVLVSTWLGQKAAVPPCGSLQSCPCSCKMGLRTNLFGIVKVTAEPAFA